MLDIDLFKYIIIYLLLFIILEADEIRSIKFKDDDSSLRVAAKLDPKSHIKIFLPSIPYSYISKNTNAGLIRSDDNDKGWVYDLARSHKRVDDLTYIFEIRKNLKFQDGSSLDIDSVINNLNHFKKHPFLYTNIDKIDFNVTQIDKYRFQIKLKQKYEMFFLDLARIYFYTDEYLKKYSPKGGETGSANAMAGAFGMGPYILKSGYALGEKQSSKLELVANPYYWDKRFPKIKKVTVYTQLNMNKALDYTTNYESKLDITPIAFNKKIDVIMSRYAKLVIKQSTNNFIIYFNLINGNKQLKNKEVRQALNQALDQENLLNFVYKKEGKVSPFSTSINYKIVQKIANKNQYPKNNLSQQKIDELLNGLILNVVTQDRFMFLWKGIEFQLKKYGVKLNFNITTSEKDIYHQLFNTKVLDNTKSWDMLTWGDDDWYYKNPWTVFFIYEKNSPWSTIQNDDIMQKNIEKFFKAKIDTQEYEKIVSNILYRAKDMAYTLKVPSHNKVIAVNKEVIYKPYQGGIIPLWKIQITKDHWSIRKEKEYPLNLQTPIKPQRVNNETYK